MEVLSKTTGLRVSRNKFMGGKIMKKCIGIIILALFTSINAYCEDVLTIYPNGNVGIGTEIQPEEKLKVDGTIKTTERVFDKTGSIAPIGSIVMWPKENPPLGWLECDGRAISRVEFSDLYDVLGLIYGNGDGISTFNIPDMRGFFVRGWNHQRSDEWMDPDAENRIEIASGGLSGNHVGTRQQNQIQEHDHQFKTGNERGYCCGGASSGNCTHGICARTERTGGNETRPKNIYMMFIIKY
jgi:microcystin-dependent protein